MDVYENQYANVHRGIHWLSEQSTDLYEEARESVREFINAEQRHEVIFTTGATAAINLVARSWGDAHVTEGDEILLTEMEHHSNIVPWQQLAERTGCRVRFVPITDDGLLCMDSVDQMLTERTRLVAFSAVSNVLGTINPVGELIERAHAVGALASDRCGTECSTRIDGRAGNWKPILLPSAATRCWGLQASVCCMVASRF